MSGFNRPTGNTGGGDKTSIESLGKGKFKARLVGVVNLGTFQDTYKGELKKPTDKMSLLVEVIGKTVELGEETYPRCMWVNPFNFWATLTKKGKEIQHYLAFDEMAEEGDTPDWESMLGKAIYVVNKPTTKGDDTYDNIASLAAMDEEVAANLDEAKTELFIDSADNVEDKLFGLAKYQYEQPRYDGGTPETQAEADQTDGFAPDSDDLDNPFS